jgi:drug/metabolite transporter (DMT)-like permease
MDNLRGALLMVLAMLGFAFEDMLVKLMAGRLPTWQIILSLGIGGALVFGALIRLRGQPLFTRLMLHPAVLLRNLGELVGTLGFVTAIVLIPLSTASVILQATPLAVTLGAALFLAEPVGWRRWAAILVGFAGVLLVLRPGGADFEPAALFAVQGVVGLTIRDLATRRAPRETTSLQLTFLAFLTLVPTSVILALAIDLPAVRPDARDWG